MNKQEEKWTVTNERYVGFIDIMGFKDMVMRNTHIEMYEMMKKIDNSKKRTREQLGAENQN